MINTILVLGVGNPFRGDDIAGWAVIDALKGKVPDGVELIKVRGEISELLDFFGKYSIIYLIDACSMKAPLGFYQRIDAIQNSMPDTPQTSTHGLSISQAVDLAKIIKQMPSKLIVYAINGDQYNIGTTLSPSVAKAAQIVVQNILKEEDIVACMKKV